VSRRADFSQRITITMNAPEKIAFLPDVQAQPDLRGLRIDAVGIKGVRYPLAIRVGNRDMSTVATLSMTVALAATEKGTHMSRFLEVLEAQVEPLDPPGLRAMLQAMLASLQAESGGIEMRFPYFVRKSAPVSGVHSLSDHDACWRVSGNASGPVRFDMQVMVPATSLCPCSKEISAYGAHNQRSHITIDVEMLADLAMDDLIGVAERSASCEVYGLLKRADEKFVTERAYDNPKFVEDVVREVALALEGDVRIGAWVVEAENFESIHNHSAFARIAGGGSGTQPAR
jgi:GTP cyclohydrolase I